MEKYDAFISYKRTNLHTAEMIRMKLETHGVHCYMDKHGLVGGDTWEEALYQNIIEAPNFICILTDDAIDSLKSSSRRNAIFKKEINTALRYRKIDGKNFLPVLCNGYHFPDEWESGTPKVLYNLQRLQAIEFNDTEMDASIERIISNMRNLVHYTSNVQYRTDGIGFIEDVLNSELTITTAYLMFHAGADWFKEATRRDKLERLVNSGLKLRVLLNTQEAAMILAQHMTHPGLRYTSFEDSISDWVAFSKKYPQQVEVRISDIPILRRMYMLAGDDLHNAIMRVSYYTYQGMDVQKNCCQILSKENNKQYFDLYHNEFEYLWKKALGT